MLQAHSRDAGVMHGGTYEARFRDDAGQDRKKAAGSASKTTLGL